LIPSQAARVTGIFERCAAGDEITRIAKGLNEASITPPRGVHGWASTAIREILHRSLYAGEVVWGRKRKRDAWGTKAYLAQPESDWLRLANPTLRIVSDDLWRAAYARLAAARTVYVRERNAAAIIGEPLSPDVGRGCAPCARLSAARTPGGGRA